MTDKAWKALVYRIARGVGAGASPPALRRAVLTAEEYLWARENWERLAEGPHGLFLRELTSDIPDLALRSSYRDQVLAGESE